MRQYIVDYASVDHDAPPDLAAARAAGVVGCIIRADYGRMRDDTFQRDAAHIVAAGMALGAYSFWLHGADAPIPSQETPEAELDAFDYETAGFFDGGKIAIPPMGDLEWPRGVAHTGLTRPQLMDSIRAHITTFRDHFGAWPLLYESGRVWNTTDKDTLADPPAPDLVDCPLALAHYVLAAGQPWDHEPHVPPTIPHPWDYAQTHSNYWFHQYQGDARGVPGFSSTVDVSVFNTLVPGDRSERVEWLRRRAGDAGPKATGDSLVYDAALFEFVKSVQKDHGLVVDGIVGLFTWEIFAWRL